MDKRIQLQSDDIKRLDNRYFEVWPRKKSDLQHRQHRRLNFCEPRLAVRHPRYALTRSPVQRRSKRMVRSGL